MRIRDTDLAYIAGVIDGEGCLLVHRNKQTGHMQPRIVVAMQTPDCPRFIDQCFEGVGAYREIKLKNGKTRYQWGVYAKSTVMGVIEVLGEYLRVKAEQAEILYEFCQSSSTGERRALAQALRDAK